MSRGRNFSLRVVCLLFFGSGAAWSLTAEAFSSDHSRAGVSFVEGKQAALFLHRPVSSFRVYAFHNGAPVPIPFQIDERDRRERWALDQGVKPNTDDSPGIFDENDVLVF